MGMKGFIIALIILEAGLFLIRQLGAGFLSGFPVVGGIGGPIAAFSGMLDIFLLALGVLILLLIVFAVLKGGKPKKAKEVPAEKEMFEEREEAEEKEEKEEEKEEPEEAEEEETEEEHMRKG